MVTATYKSPSLALGKSPPDGEALSRAAAHPSLLSHLLTLNGAARERVRPSLPGCLNDAFASVLSTSHLSGGFRQIAL